MSHCAIKVALALDATIVLAGAIVELAANPDSWSEFGLADEADNGIAAVCETNELPSRQV